MNYNHLVEAIYRDDYQLQESMLASAASDIRKSPVLKDTFIHNKLFVAYYGEYIKDKGGSSLTDTSLDLYNKYGELKDEAKLWIPLYSLYDDVIGFAFYDDGSIDDNAPVKYRMQRTFDVRNHMNIRRQTYIDAIKDGYILVNDGFMDKYHIEAYGIHSASLYGSSLSMHKLNMLRAIDHVVLCMDNDEAGSRLAKQMREQLGNVHILKQRAGKDMDDYLKSNPNNYKLLQEYVSSLTTSRRYSSVYELGVA